MLRELRPLVHLAGEREEVSLQRGHLCVAEVTGREREGEGGRVGRDGGKDGGREGGKEGGRRKGGWEGRKEGGGKKGRRVGGRKKAGEKQE